jgi:hypothetical protein
LAHTFSPELIENIAIYVAVEKPGTILISSEVDFLHEDIGMSLVT